MARHNLVHSLTFTTLMAIAMATTKTTTSTASDSPIKGAYWFEQPTFPASAINTTHLTHVFYAFLTPSNTTHTLQITESTSTSLAEFSATLRSKNPPVKMLASIGGADSDAAALFALIAADADRRAAFIGSAIAVARRFRLDGLDLDWEYPRNASEMRDLAVLIREWRLAILAESKFSGRKPLLLTAAVYFSAEFFLSAGGPSYPVAAINKNLDWINVMSYDLHGSWDNETGAPTALFDPKGNVNVVFGIRSWIRAGLCPEKMVMGLPLYGKKWTLREWNVNGMGASAIGIPPESGGVPPFFQIEEFINGTGATVVYDADTVSAYSYSATSWIGYDDPLTVTAKIGFAQALGLRGYFFWAAGYDRDWKITAQASKSWIIS